MGPRVGPAHDPEGVPASTPLRRLCPAVVNRCCLGAGEIGNPVATLEEPNMSEKKVVLVTGAGRGMGVDIARAALDAGHRVVATARNADRVTQALGSSDDLLAVSLDVTDPAERAGRGRRRRGAVRPDRRAGQQRRQLLRRVLRGDHPRRLPRPGRDEPVRPAERHPRRAAGDARPALRARRDDQLHRRADRAGVLQRLRRLQVRPRRLHGVPRPRGRAVRHPHDGGGARVLPHRPADPGVDQLRRVHDRRLHRAHRSRPSRPGTG